MTTPAPTTHHLGRRPVLGAGIVTAAVCVVLMMWIDAPVALFLNNFQATPLVAGFKVITNLANSGIWYALALIGMGIALVRARVEASAAAQDLLRRRLRAGVFLISSMVASGVLINGIKLLVGRDRPRVLFSDGVAGFHPLAQSLTASGFPSGHAQSITGAMIAIAWIYPPLRFACLLVAVVISASRVIVGAHFVSDIIAGAFLAIAVALIFRAAFERDGIPLDLTARQI